MCRYLQAPRRVGIAPRHGSLCPAIQAKTPIAGRRTGDCLGRIPFQTGGSLAALNQVSSIEQNLRVTRRQFRSGSGLDAVSVREAFGLAGKSILAGAPLDKILPENDAVGGRKWMPYLGADLLQVAPGGNTEAARKLSGGDPKLASHPNLFGQTPVLIASLAHPRMPLRVFARATCQVKTKNCSQLLSPFALAKMSVPLGSRHDEAVEKGAVGTVIGKREIGLRVGDFTERSPGCQ